MARLRSARQFQRVYQRGQRATGRLVTVVGYRHRQGGGARLGVSVSKEHGAAVRRNKIKRLLREAFRLERHAFPSDLDVVLIPRKSEARLDLGLLRSELVQLVDRLARDQGQPNRPRIRRAAPPAGGGPGHGGRKPRP